jgi:hypothetical protein
MGVVACVAAAAALGGCGLGSGPAATNTALRVSKDFGSQPLLDTDTPKTGGSDTVMRLLERNEPKVTTKYGGNFVQSIAGVSGGQSGGKPADWFYYVNGVEGDRGATAVHVHEGDRVWWDWHNWSVTDDVPAVVGSYPEPFLHGVNGHRLPTRVECFDPKSKPCNDVQSALVALGLPAAKGGVGNSFVEDTLRIVVGPWQAVQGDNTLKLIDEGPAKSGVYVRPAADGRTFSLLDPNGRVTRTLGAGTGLIAATVARDTKAEDGTPENDPVWVVTGTDAAGVQSAADALDEGALAGRFAAIISDGKPIGLPDLGG